MKSKILEALKAKFVGFDEKTLGRMADKLVSKVAKEEDITTAVEGVTFQELADSYKDAAVTAGINTAISNYETKYNLKDGKPVQQQQQQQQQQSQQQLDPNVAAIMAAMQQQSEQIKQLTGQLNGMQQKSIAEQRMATLDGVLKNAPEAFRNITKNNFGLMQFDSDEAFNQYVEGIKTTAESMANDLNARSGIFSAPFGGGATGQKQVNSLVQQRAEQRMAMQGNGSAIQGLPQQPASAPVQATAAAATK